MVKGGKIDQQENEGNNYCSYYVHCIYVNSANKCIHKISPPIHKIIFLQMKIIKTRLSNCMGQSN